MTVRDLGYKAYEGDRLPPSQNTWVMLRHGLRRVWSGWPMTVIAVCACFLPLGAAIVAPLLELGLFQLISRPDGERPTLSANEWLNMILWLQMWLILVLVTVLRGAGVIAGDFANKAFQFYFSKPVLPVQYLVGRTGALAVTLFGVLVAPTAIAWLAMVASASQEMRLERLGLILPMLLHGALIALVLSAGSIGSSSLSKSRALTVSAWLLVFLLPYVIAAIVDNIAEWPWLYLISIPGMIEVIGDALFKVEAENALRWWHALPAIAAVVALGLWGASARVRRAEVIT